MYAFIDKTKFVSVETQRRKRNIWRPSDVMNPRCAYESHSSPLRTPLGHSRKVSLVNKQKSERNGYTNCHRNWHIVGLSKNPTQQSISQPLNQIPRQGFEAIKQLLEEKQQSYNFILGARDTAGTQAAYDALKFDTAKHSVDILPLDLSDLRSVQSFAKQALSQLGQKKLDSLFLVAGTLDNADGPGPHGSQWCESYVVNHLGMLLFDLSSGFVSTVELLLTYEKNAAQHYLIHLLADTLAASQSRLAIVSSGAIRGVRGNDPCKSSPRSPKSLT
jgi:hypothetical protein